MRSKEKRSSWEEDEHTVAQVIKIVYDSNGIFVGFGKKLRE